MLLQRAGHRAFVSRRREVGMKMLRTATGHGRRSDGVRTMLSVVAIVTGTWLSGVVDRPAAGSSSTEAIGEIGGAWTWVAETPGEDSRSDEPIVSTSKDVPCGTAADRTSVRMERVATRKRPEVMVPLRGA